jgi:putative mRNA 3-end processing factor
MIRPEDILHPTPSGLYCPPLDAFIDPVRAVDRAVITHGHSDHARPGHANVLATTGTLAAMEVRYGPDFTGSRQAAAYGETICVGETRLTLLPAGHVLGSAQVLIEHGGLKMICTGDYKRRRDPTCPPFEPVGCHILISEATFALPVFTHPPPEQEIERLLASLAMFPDRTHLVGVYAFGKAQRVICLLREAGHGDPIIVHGALEGLNALYEREGIALGPLERAPDARTRQSRSGACPGRIVLAPPSALRSSWSNRFADPLHAFASGWMTIRQRARAAGVELALSISDHADWGELTQTVRDVDPEELWITHGRDDALARWAELEGRRARPLRLIGYEEEHGE